MKYRHFFICLCILVFLIPVSLHSQINLGVLGGLNLSDAKIEDNTGSEFETSGQTGFVGGLLLEKSFTENIRLGVNVLYMRHGVKVKTIEDLEFDVRASYIEVPLYLKWSFGSEVRPHLFIGPNIGFLLNSDVEVELAGVNFTGDFSTVLKNLNFSLIVGAGVDIPIARGNLFIQASYLHSFYDIMKGGVIELKAGETLRQEATTDEGDKIFTRGFQFMAGYTFPLGL